MVYGIVLMILIPLLIVLNTVFIIQKYNESLDVTLQRQALNLGRSVQVFLQDDLASSTRLQAGVDKLMESNTDLMNLLVLKPSGEDFRISAAHDRAAVGEVLDFYYFHMAWKQPVNNGLVTDSLRLARTDKGDYFQKEIDPDQERFWLVAMPMANEQGEKSALLTMKVSSQIVDELTEYNRDASVYLLIFTVLVVVLFLLAVVRIWDYALLYRKIKEVDQMKDEFISVASHELRTPVTCIKGYAAMMLDGSLGELNDRMRQSAEKIEGSADRLGVLVEDLLDVSRIEQNRLAMEPEMVDVDQKIGEVVDEFRGQARDKGIGLSFRPRTKKPPQIKVDPYRLHQILANLIGNAVKYTHEGGVEVFTEYKDKHKLHIKVKDTGIGMSARERERLFSKFYRVRSEKTKNISGTGLGLWITKQLVELMGGTITVDSIENVGSQFTVTFPIFQNNDK